MRKSYHNRHHNYSRDNSGVGCAVMAGLAIIAMPLVGGYMLLTGRNDEQKLVGLVLLILGCILWIGAALQ